MSTPLAFRALARSTSNSPLSGLGYATLILADDEELKVRAPVRNLESVEMRRNVQMVVTTHWAVVREDLVQCTRQGVLREGDRFMDDEGNPWDIRNPVRNGGGEWRFDLIKPQARPVSR